MLLVGRVDVNCGKGGCELAQNSSQEQDFPESNLLQRGSRTPEELMRFSEADLAWFSFPLEHQKIRRKCSLGNPASKSVRESKKRLL
jgi:hypothetical protein